MTKETDDFGNEIKRWVWTFDKVESAHDMIEFLLKAEYMPVELWVEEFKVERK